ncbi:MAG: DUF541 domain-containing protein [SAR202 cluster bacterium]|nr:DUF541 domain-containing protein [SAR202 cluster bacterium]
MHHVRFPRVFLGLALVAVLALAAACSSDDPSTLSTSTNLPVGAPAGVVSGIDGLARASTGLTSVSSQQAGIWVNGVGTVVTEPNITNLSLGVEASASTVTLARNEAATAMTAIVAFLTSNGVAERDIRTQSFNISPQYTFRERLEDGFRTNERVLTGYQVTNTVSVKVRELDQTGAILDGVVKAGGDLIRINGISFTVDDPSPLKVQARELAVQEAMKKAQELATLAGVGLGQLIFISETSSTPIFNRVEARGDFARAASFAATPISAGETQIQVSVQAVFAIQ